MKLFVLLIVTFFNNAPRDMGTFPYTSLEKCEEGRKEAQAELHKPPVIPGLEFWTTCVEVTREVKPQFDPKHRDPKSEKAT
jgi:hypothetical protein